MDSVLAQPVATMGVINGMAQFTAILAPLLILKLVAQQGNSWVLVLTTTGMAVGLIPITLFAHWTAAGLGRLVITVMWATWLPTLQIYQMDLVDERWRALAYGIASMAIGFGFGTSSCVGGYIIAAWGYRALFGMGIALTLAATTLMWVGSKRLTAVKS